MARPGGLQREILASLLLVMATATATWVVVMLRTQQEQMAPLRDLAAQALIDEAQRVVRIRPVLSPLQWWTVAESGAAVAVGEHDEHIDGETQALAAEARARRSPLLRTGAPWEPVRFAMPLAGGEVAAARLPSATSPWNVLGLLLADVAVFTAFAMVLLRRRMVAPLQGLASAARAIADGAVGTRAPVAGVAEIAEVGTAFNEMTGALESRTQALEKAVADLRESNRNVRRVREGLDRAERLAAVGHLAAGVAHEVGNPMGALLAFLDLVRRDPGLSEQGRGHLARAAQEGERVRKILRQLLDFSRPPRTQRAAVDVVSLCRETVDLVAAQRRYAPVRFVVVREGEPPAAHADAGVVQQILLNLLLNAADAATAHEAPEPAVTIAIRPATEQVRPGDLPGAGLARAHPDAVECVVSDNGPGVRESDRERIFDPFFTSKDPGEGTGLGLANALRFAEELGGRLELESGPGPGARFALRLPAAGAPRERTQSRRP